MALIDLEDLEERALRTRCRSVPGAWYMVQVRGDELLELIRIARMSSRRDPRETTPDP